MNAAKDRTDQFGQLLSEVSKLWRHQLNTELKPYGLNCTLRSLLQELSDIPEGLMQRELAHRVGIESATLVGLIDRLSSSGWVERELSSVDRRRKTVRLTKLGRQLLSRSENVIRSLRQKMLEGASSEDLDACIRLFSNILSRHQALHSAHDGEAGRAATRSPSQLPQV